MSAFSVAMQAKDDEIERLRTTLVTPQPERDGGVAPPPPQADTIDRLQRELAKVAGRLEAQRGELTQARTDRDALADRIREMAPLVDAVQLWCGDCEGQPGDPSDARLLQAIWRHDGDRTQPCDECDGECGEPCAPC